MWLLHTLSSISKIIWFHTIFSFSEVIHRLRMRNRKAPNRKGAKYKIFGSPQTGYYVVSGEIPRRGLIQITQPSSLSDTIWTRLGELGECDSLDWRRINQGDLGELCSPLQSLFSPHWCQQPGIKAVIRAILAANKTVYLLLAHVIPSRSAIWLAHPSWNRRWLILNHVLIDQPLPLLCHAHLQIWPFWKTSKKGKTLTLIFSCWWYLHSFSKANTKSPHLKSSKSRTIFHIHRRRQSESYKRHSS